MIVGLLQLSDIHIEAQNNSILSKHDKIPWALQEYIYQLDHLFIIITGDSAFSGREIEYLQVMQMIDNIKKDILSIKRIELSILIIPGNHDCFLPELPVRSILIKNIQSGMSSITKDEISILTDPQKEFFEYLKCYEETSALIFDELLLKTYSFELNGKKIVFNCFNSSWISERKETPGTLYFPVERYTEHLSKVEGDLIISAIHHPNNWYIPENGRALRSVLEKYSDLILTGHEHVATAKKIENFDGERVQYIEGGVLQETGVEHISNFNFILFDLEEELQKITRFTWNEDYYSNSYASGWMNYYHANSARSTHFILSDNYQAKLDDPEINLKHPRKAKVILGDIYIYPDAKIVISDEKTSKFEQIINLEKITLDCKLNVIVFGSERSGKTSLCKMIYSHFYNKGYVPVYINAVDIKARSLEDFNKTVYKNFSIQYSKEMIERYKQLDHKKKILIIDDMEKFKQPSEVMSRLLKQIKEVYPNLIITGSEMLKFSNIIEISEEKNEVFEQFEKYEILQFGHYQRSKLIDKWNNIGNSALSEVDLLEKNDRITADINTVIGNNFVPSFPFFLLIIIQTAESDIPHSYKDSAYGYYYELLITQSFINIDIQPKELDAYYTYISELAYYVYKNEVYEISDTELWRFNNYLCQKYDLDHEYERTVTRLVDSSILEKLGDYYRFKLNYIYYYFVAKYLSSRITNPDIRAIIKDMCLHLHIEENANIIMFLTHLSKDPYILDSLYEKALEIFDEFTPTKLEDDIGSLNTLVSEIPKLVYRNIEVKKHREERLIAKDEADLGRRESAITSHYRRRKNKDSVMDVVTKLNVAFKTIELLGQILKNYYGSIEAEQKYILTEEVYMIGLRTLNSFLSLITDNVENVAINLQKIIEKQETNESHHDSKLAGKLLFNICCVLSYQIFIKIAESVGSKNMRNTFSQITENNKFTSIRLIEIAIKLDQLRSLPYPDIKLLKEDVEKNVMALSILKLLVINHLYMYDTNRIDKQRICDLLGIPIDKQITIDLTSSRKKDR
ncbi:metallophosphoesterase [Paenibacillus sp. FSL W7-1332]|uniref:STAND family AAA ATPase n=1 Tax=Paenibacillus sp. FSL W7-1332 TaxID=2921702 RepID=UPI0030CEE2C3